MNHTTTPSPVLDPAHLERVSGGAPEVQRDLLGLLGRELPRLQARLAQAEANGDPAELRATAHKLQGMAAYTGARRLGDAAAELALALREGGQGRIAQALAELRVALEELAWELAQRHL